MVNELENRLRQALAERAQQVPASAGARLRERDYGPRTGRVRPRLAVGVLAASAGTAGVIVAIVGPGASNALAGWASTPTSAPDTQIAAAQATCHSQIARATSHFSAPVLSDTRGPFTVLIFQNGAASTSCITGPDFTAVTTSAGGTASGSVTARRGSTGPTGPTGPEVMTGGPSDAGPTPAGTVRLAGIQLKTPGGQPYALAEGHTGAGVTAVTLVLSDGTHVTATTDHGWFAAWWPGAQNATAAVVTTAGRPTITQHVAEPPVLPSPPALTMPSNTTCTAVRNGVTCHGSGHAPAPVLGTSGAPLP